MVQTVTIVTYKVKAIGIFAIIKIRVYQSMKKIQLAAFFLLFTKVLLAQSPLLIPDTLSGSNINLELRNDSIQFYPGTITQTMGVNGKILGPTLILYKHQNVTMNVTNKLTDTSTVHWHGMHVAPQNDGGPHTYILPNANWSPSFEVLDAASTYWYHPHLHMKTYDHVQKGIAGFIIVRDTIESKLALPRRYGVDDFPLVMQSKGVDASNQFITEHTALDTALFVNGTIKPYLNAPAQVIRLRVLNGSPERVYNIGFSDNKTFYQIGSDGGLLTAPVALTRLIIAPGERYEILVDLSSGLNQTIALMNYGAEIPNARYGAKQPGMGPGLTIPGYSSNPLNGANFTILTINVGNPTSNPITTIPSSLITHNPYLEASSNATRSLVFTTMGGITGPFVINGTHFDMDFVNMEIPFNNTEIWEVRNQTPIAHPLHIHNIQFYILTMNGVAPPLGMRGKKDVVLIPGGNATVRLITKFEDFYNDTLPYMYHCHMLSHEDEGMMGQFLVKSPCNLLKSSPTDVNAKIGDNVSFNVEVTDTTGVSYQWQGNTGFGFVDMQNLGQYSGVKSAKLSISQVSAANNNTLYRCVVKNSSCEITSNSVLLSVGTTGLNTFINSLNLTLYPNPANESISLQWRGKMDQAIVFVTDPLGKIVMKNSQIKNGEAINIHHLEAGIYIMTVQMNGHNKSIKFIKN